MAGDGFPSVGAVVVPVGSEVLGSHREQGFVTQSVTNYLNVAGAVAIAVWCWDIAADMRRVGVVSAGSSGGSWPCCLASWCGSTHGSMNF